MLEFLSLYLGLVWGIQPVHLRVEAPVARVEIRLGDRPVALLTEPPWSANVDFGEGPLPLVLTAEAWDRQGELVARIAQVLNMPRPDAEASLVLERSGEHLSARLTWQSIEGSTPTDVSVKLDGERISFESSEAIPLPEVDDSEFHLLEAEVKFSEVSTIRAHLTFGAEFSDATQAGLTAVPVQVIDDEILESNDLGRFFRDTSHPSERLRAIAVERGPADLLVVRDRAIKSSIDAIGLQAYLPRSLLDTTSTRIRYLQTKGVLVGDDRIYFLNPIASEIQQADFVSELFERSAPISSRDSSLFWASVRASWGEKGDQRLADAIAVAGLYAARGNGRRAVLLMISERPEDKSGLTPRAARRYLRALQVPLLVWVVSQHGEITDDDWQASESIASHQEFQAAARGLKASLAKQAVVWLEGLHLPQQVSLEGAEGLLEISTASLLSLEPVSSSAEPLASPGDSLRVRLNQERAERGLPYLRSHDLLDTLAMRIAAEIGGDDESGRKAVLERAIIPLLEGMGYEAEQAAKSVQWGSAEPEEMLDAWIAQEERDRSFAFDPAMKEIGVGWDRTAGNPVVVVIFARSQASAFEQRTREIDDLGTVYAEMLKLVNDARKEQGVSRLDLHPLLTIAAQSYADAMLDRSFYGHVSPDGSDVSQRIEATGYRFEMAAENLAEGPTSASEVITAWLGSPLHRENILNPRLQETGFGLAYGENENGRQILWVQCLARPANR